MRVVRSGQQTRPALVPIRDKSRGSLTSKIPSKSRACAYAPLATPCKPPGKSQVIMRAQRGAPAPLPHCGGRFRKVSSDVNSIRPNEGRRRPSLIAARPLPDSQERARKQRGAPAPLPHCGRAPRRPRLAVIATRGAGAPPSLRRGLRRLVRVQTTAATRGAGAPPSLRREAAVALIGPGSRSNNEGRRRPSLIAAPDGGMLSASPVEGNEGRRRPSLIAARAALGSCGRWWPTRGAGAPPSLRPIPRPPGCLRRATPTRGAGAPPSLRQGRVE